MTPPDARLERSRRTLAKLAEALAAGDIAAPPGRYLSMIAAEIEALTEIAAEHPSAADSVAYLIERCEHLMAALRMRMN